MRTVRTALDDLIARAPQFAEAFNQRAVWFFKKGEFGRAVRDCETVMRLNPHHFGAAAGLGQCYLKMKKPRAALRAFRQAVEINPTFDDPDSCSAGNKAMRDACLAFLESKLSDPELVRRMTPPHPYLSARPLAVDSEYSVLDALKSDNVTLVTDGIRRITEAGIETITGEHHEVDVIVYATGFHATDYLFPMTIIGRDGVTIEKAWAEEIADRVFAHERGGRH